MPIILEAAFSITMLFDADQGNIGNYFIQLALEIVSSQGACCSSDKRHTGTDWGVQYIELRMGVQRRECRGGG